MPLSRTSYRLVVYQADVDPQLVRDAIAEALRMHPTDAMRYAAHAPGVVPLELSRDQVDKLLINLGAEDVDAEGWPVTRLPDLSEPRLLHKVNCRDHGLEVLGQRNEPMHWLPWEQLELLSVGMVPQQPKRRRVATPAWVHVACTALGAGPASPMRSRTGEGNAVPELWIVRNRPVVALRIQQNRMNYEYLGERLRPSATANFRLLIEDLRRAAPGASITPSTHSFWIHERPGTHFFSSAQALMEYTTLQLLKRWRAMPEKGQPPPS